MPDLSYRDIISSQTKMILDLILENKPQTLAIVSISVAATFIYYIVLLPFFISPLASIPGPRLAAITKYYILYKTWSEQRNRLVHSLHAQYGPIVRLGPDEVSISDPAYIKEIYSANFDKSSFYGQFGNYGRLNAFSTLEKTPHIHRRRVTAQLYSKSYVTSQPIEEIARSRVVDAIKHIQSTLSKAKTDKPFVEVYEVFHALAMDVVTGLILGRSRGTTMLRQDRSTWGIINDYRLQSSMWFWTTLMPQFYDLAAGKDLMAASKRAQDWNVENCERALTATEKGAAEGSILRKLYDSGVQGYDAFSEIQDHVAAGHETTGATLSFLAWHLSKHPDVQQRLHEELVAAFGECPDTDTDTNTSSSTGAVYVPAYSDVEKLPYLNGVVMETLRIYTAIPGAEPRVVPPSGMMWKGTRSETNPVDEKDMMVYIPGGTVVSMQPWTLHRDESVYPNALKFDPTRWIDCPEEELRRMNRSFMAFGAGVRMCLGLHLATEEIKLMVTSLYWRYKTTVAPGYDDEAAMYVTDKYTVHPRGHYTLLEFTRL